MFKSYFSGFSKSTDSSGHQGSQALLAATLQSWAARWAGCKHPSLLQPPSIPGSLESPGQWPVSRPPQPRARCELQGFGEGSRSMVGPGWGSGGDEAGTALGAGSLGGLQAGMVQVCSGAAV